MATLKARALSGSIWTIGGYGTSQIIRLGSHLVLAWLLAPKIFGLMALVKVLEQGIHMFSDIGIRPSIIQNKRGDDPLFLNTAWTIQIIRGLGVWICLCILAWPFAALFARNDPAAWQLTYLVPVSGFTSVLLGFNSTSLATLNRRLQVGRLTLLDLASQMVSLTVMITWALISPSVWAMIAGGLSSAAFSMVVSHVIIPGYKVRMWWDKECARELFKFGKYIFLSTLFTFLALNLDKLILANILSLTDLGVYSIAFVFAKVALDVSSKLGGTVLFPVYSKYRNDPEHMLWVALRARHVVLWGGASVCLGFALIAPLFFKTFWDVRYHEAGNTAQWFSPYIWTMILLFSIDRIPLALGNSRALFVANVLRCAAILLAVGGYYVAGLEGFIIGLAFGPLLALWYLSRYLLSGRKKILRQGVIFTAGMALYALPSLTILQLIRDNTIMLQWSITLSLACIPVATAAVIVVGRVRAELKP